MDTFYRTLILLVTMAFSLPLCAQEKVSKKIEKTYSMSNAGELYLDNKYGDIIINGWDKNTIKIIGKIKVTHKKKENAKSLLERIDLSIKNTNDFVSITSEISEKSTSFFSKYFNKANPFDFDKSNIQIDYEIFLPLNAEINITNKFGDVIIDDFTGRLKANVQHGDLWINENLTNANIEMKFGKLNAKSIMYGKISLKNGEINLDESKDLRIYSSGTDIHINKVSVLELYSSKDEVTIEEIGRIRGELKFSNVLLNSVDEEIKLGMNLADFRVTKIQRTDAIIAIEQESSELDITITNLAFKFTATLEQGLLRIPRSFKNVNTDVLDKGKKLREVTGTYGTGALGKFTITGKKGIIVLKE